MTEQAETVRDYLVRVIGEPAADRTLVAGHVRIGADERVSDPARPLQTGEYPVIVPWG